jgi:predicted lactoylglutathione lyase
MKSNLFINLPVKNIQKTNAFFNGLGFKFNRKFSDEKATCMIINDSAYVMLLQNSFFKSFIKNEIVNARKSTEAILSIQKQSKAAVNKFAEKAIKLGGKKFREPYDYGFMYGKSFQDLDGHIWEVFWMDAAKMPKAG